MSPDFLPLTTVNYELIDAPATSTSKSTSKVMPIIIWAHGWGQDLSSLKSIAEGLNAPLQQFLIDLPGFGQTPTPNTSYTTRDYAQHIADWLAPLGNRPIIWIGHSFGCRVGLQFAKLFPKKIVHLCCIAGAGLQRTRTPWQKFKLQSRIYTYKALKKITPLGPMRTQLDQFFGSRDFQAAGVLRNIFVTTVNEDLTSVAQQVLCPTTLIYGELDTETPPEFGSRYARLIPQSTVYILPDQDHYSLIGNGQHQVIRLIYKQINYLF